MHGPDAFYTGAIANATITALQAANGTMTLDDLKNYSVAIRKPAQITYRDFKLTACSAPSSGEVALSVMKTVEGYQGFGEEAMLNLSTHRLDEAIRFGYGEVSFPFLQVMAFCLLMGLFWRRERILVTRFLSKGWMSIRRRCSMKLQLLGSAARFRISIRRTFRRMRLRAW